MATAERKRRTAAVSAGSVGIWEALRDAVAAAPVVRPENSVTAAEYAEKTGYTPNWSRTLLAAMAAGKSPKLRAVPFMSVSGRRSVCYVPVEGS